MRSIPWTQINRQKGGGVALSKAVTTTPLLFFSWKSPIKEDERTGKGIEKKRKEKEQDWIKFRDNGSNVSEGPSLSLKYVKMFSNFSSVSIPETHNISFTDH